MIFKGFRFGMLLQLAIGPMCLLVFNTSAKFGIEEGFSLVLAISLIDLLFITLSGIGVSAIIDRKNIKTFIKIFGAFVLIFFGANMIGSAFHINLIPGIHLLSGGNKKDIFLQGLLLTASNPLTIIFWSGVFSTQVIENNYNRVQLGYFGFGCVLSTVVFLSMIAFLGTIISSFLSPIIMNILNIAVGSVIIYFGLRLMLRRTD